MVKDCCRCGVGNSGDGIGRRGFSECCPCQEVNTVREASVNRQVTQRYKEMFNKGSVDQWATEGKAGKAQFETIYMRDFQHPDISALHYGYNTRAAGVHCLTEDVIGGGVRRSSSCPPTGRGDGCCACDEEIVDCGDGNVCGCLYKVQYDKTKPVEDIEGSKPPPFRKQPCTVEECNAECIEPVEEDYLGPQIPTRRCIPIGCKTPEERHRAEWKRMAKRRSRALSRNKMGGSSCSLPRSDNCCTPQPQFNNYIAPQEQQYCAPQTQQCCCNTGYHNTGDSDLLNSILQRLTTMENDLSCLNQQIVRDSPTRCCY